MEENDQLTEVITIGPNGEEIKTYLL